LALYTPRLIVDPAQLRTSVAKREGSGLSLEVVRGLIRVLCWDPYDGSAVDTNDKVEPRLYCELGVLVPQYLKAVSCVRTRSRRLLRV